MMEKGKFQATALAGSMQFFDTMLETAEELSSRGEIVLIPWKDKRSEIPKEAKKRYAEVQRQRIDMCDRLYVINVDSYIGPSTLAEISYAESIGKHITYYASNKPKIVTLIGSGRFRDEFKRIEAELVRKGYLVFQPSIFNYTEFYELDDETDAILDLVHRQKMEMSEEVIVVNMGGYVGEDTQAEIDWARERGLKVFYWYHTEKGDMFDA